MVIPNSKLVINPGAEPDEWHKELYLRPGQWIPWVGVTVVGTMVAVSGIVLVLHLNGKVRLPRDFAPIVDDFVCCSTVSSFSCSWDVAGGRAGAAACIASYQLRRAIITYLISSISCILGVLL